MLQVCILFMLLLQVTTNYLILGSFQILIGDDHNVHKTTVCRVIKKVTREIARLRPQYVRMPNGENEIRTVKTLFYQIRQFPNVIGCVDGTHIPIQSPGGANAEIFRNRKGYFSVNVQVICDSKLLIRDIVARWPGSTHDSTMFNASLIGVSLEANEFPGSYLLGDSAYSCKEYLLTPISNPTTQSENNYNAAHIQTRNTVERTFGVWKRRFPCLKLGLRTFLRTSLEVIIATAVLHNIATLQNDYFDNLEEVNENIDIHINENDNIGGVALRRHLIEHYFS